MQSNKPDTQNQKNCHNVPESISEDSDSDNSEDSGNLVIKEDTEEDTEQNEKETKHMVLNPIEKLPVECHEEKDVLVKQESNVEDIDTKNKNEEVKSEDCPPPSSTSEVFILFY